MLPLHPHDPPTIGPYRLFGRLGSDGTAHRYAGGTSGHVSAMIVLLRPGRATDPLFRGEFARRVEALRKLRSPYVCRMVGADTRGAVPWVAFARADEGTLAELLKRSGGGLPGEEFPAVATALAAGLADLHEAGVSVGPLRAEDVLLASDGAMLAGAVSAEPSGEAAEDVRHWALLMSAAAGGAGPPLRFRKVIDGCLHPDPDLRPTSRELVRMITGTGAGRESGPSTVGRRPWRRVLVPVAAVVLAVAAVAATALVAARDESADSADAPETVVADCTEAEGFAPAAEQEADDLEIFSHMAFSPDGDLLVMHTLQDELSVWDWRKGREIARPSTDLDRLAGFGFLPEGCAIAAVVMEPQPRPGEEYPTSIGQEFDLVSGTATGYGNGGSTSGTASERLPAVDGIAVSPDGLIALTGSDAVPGSGVQIVDSGSGETVDTIDSDGGSPVFLDERRLALRNYAGSSDSSGWSITVWDVHTGERLHTVRPVADGVFAPAPGTDEVVYVHGGEVIVWDIVAGHRVDAFDMDEVAELQEPWIRDVVVDPWLGRVYVTWWDSDPEDYDAETESYSGAWDLESGESLLPDGLVPRYVAPHPDGEIVAVETEEAGVRFLDPETWETVGTL
ncbi:hypothetical protein Q8791_10110 [Nocardiopsis sp. CT-R113]|uniref:Protein kinase domain-containing protein n=1 Tax=Nocardiopsis codii TaxID=3065942 RepID=A0ABU7K6T0_9ACTN|nr:hypothetical protein [Nocardiopsis sp. CT-R113]MEE2037574.1 hypothetical protein [Nocardiopsis sp. CT-R113]